MLNKTTTTAYTYVQLIRHPVLSTDISYAKKDGAFPRSLYRVLRENGVQSTAKRSRNHMYIIGSSTPFCVFFFFYFARARSLVVLLYCHSKCPTAVPTSKIYSEYHPAPSSPRKWCAKDSSASPRPLLRR